MEKKYGQIAENSRINGSIYDCFEYFNEREQKKFVKKFNDIPHNQIQFMHTFGELLLGTYLILNGFKVESERKIRGQTPDWSIIDADNQVIAVVEMVSHHLDRETENDILLQRRAGKNAVAYWANGGDPEHIRLYTKIYDKANKYRELVKNFNIPFVVAIYIDFLAGTDVEDVRDCLMNGDESLYKHFPDLSTVLHFCETNHGSYSFEPINNPFGLRKIIIPSGTLVKSR